MCRAEFRRTDNRRTTVVLKFEKDQSLFFVFREQPTAPAIRPQPLGAPVAVAVPWMVAFEKERGAPAAIVLDQLRSLSEHAEPGVKYFSGVATYRSEVDIPAEWIGPGRPVLLDWGSVEDSALVSVNGQEVANLWCPPYRREISSAFFKPGKNSLVVAVATPDGNRLIGAEQLPADVLYREAGGFKRAV